MRTKVFVSLLILVPVLAIGAAVVMYLQNAAQRTASENKSEKRVQELVGEPVLSPILSFNGQAIWYMSGTGRLYRKTLTSDAPAEEFSLPGELRSPTEIVWQRNGSDFIVLEILDGHLRYRYYDSETNRFIPYSEQIRQVRFVTSGDKIVYDWVTADSKHELKVSDATGENFRKVADLHRPDYQIVASPTEEKVVLYSHDFYEPTKLFLVDLGTGEFTDFGEKVLRQGAKFSPDGTKLLASEPELRVYDLRTKEAIGLGLVADIEQAEWNFNSSEILVGTSNPYGLKKFNVLTQTMSDFMQFGADESYVPSHILLHPTEQYLFFVDRLTGKLYKLDLASE